MKKVKNWTIAVSFIVGLVICFSTLQAQRACANVCKWDGTGCVSATMGCVCGPGCE